MKQYPEAIKILIDRFSIFPGVGPRTAERYVYFLLRQHPSAARELGEAIRALPDRLRYCERCKDYSDSNLCRICANPQRERQTVCVIAQPYDLPAIEQTGYRGTYFILGGELQPLAGIGPDQLRFDELSILLQKENPKEIILAFNPDKDGEATAIFTNTRIRSAGFTGTISRIAKGLPLGSAVEYADEVSLTAAMENRRSL